MTSSEGVYTASGLAPGTYRIDVELNGFKSVRREGVSIATGETVRIDFTLGVGAVSETLTVTGDAPALRAERTSLGAVVPHEQVVQLPLNGRAFISLAARGTSFNPPPR